MILIFSNLQDEHTQIVSDKLKSNYQEQPVILDLSYLSQRMYIEAHYNSSTDFRINFNNENSINLSTVKSFWWRRPQPVIPDPSIRHPVFREFVSNEWRTALYGIWQSTAHDNLWVNDISKDQKAENKPYQLTVAKRVGLSIPETLITNNPSEALNFWTKHQGKVVFKSFSATANAWRETRPLTQEFLKMVDTVRFAPVIFQEYIAPATDLRITIVGREIFAAEATPNNEYQFDWRMSATTSWKVHDLAPNIKELLLEFMDVLGLEYGAIDMKLTLDGQYYFLEVNTAGQFLFIELGAKLPISEALARHLATGIKNAERKYG